MGDGLEVGGAVAVLDEEALVVLEPVRRARDGVVEPVGVVVLERLARPLLHVRRRDDGLIDRQRHAHFTTLARRRLHDQLGQVVAVALQGIVQHDLAAPVGTEVRKQLADGAVAPQVAAGRRQGRRNVLDDMADAERVGDEAGQTQTLGVGVLFRHEDAQHVAGAQRSDTQGGGEARIYAARKANDGAPPPQRRRT